MFCIPPFVYTPSRSSVPLQTLPGPVYTASIQSDLQRIIRLNYSSATQLFFCSQIASAILEASCALLIRKAFWDSTLSLPRYSLILPIM